jgi:hypothetical protein
MTDFFVFFLPIPTVFSLPIPIRQQVMLSLLFAAGLVVCASGTVRIYYAYLATSNYDRTWYSFPLWISSVLELYIGIVRIPYPNRTSDREWTHHLRSLTYSADMYRLTCNQAFLFCLLAFSIWS